MQQANLIHSQKHHKQVDTRLNIKHENHMKPVHNRLQGRAARLIKNIRPASDRTVLFCIKNSPIKYGPYPIEYSAVD